MPEEVPEGGFDAFGKRPAVHGVPGYPLNFIGICQAPLNEAAGFPEHAFAPVLEGRVVGGEVPHGVEYTDF